MATKQSTVDFILDQLAGLNNVRARKMFGEYALYCDDKVVGLVCDDTLYVKITEPGKRFVGKDYQEGEAYQGAKPSMLIDGDRIENREWLSELIRITAGNLPTPKPKKIAKAMMSGGQLMKKYETVDEYISLFPQNVQVILRQLRQAIKKSAPKAEETINYGIPTFKFKGGNLVHFAAFKTHLGFYPTPSAIVAFKKELASYKQAKGSVQFPLAKPIPFDLIRKVVKFRVKEALPGAKRLVHR